MEEKRSRADNFVDWFKKGIDIMMDNIPKNITVFVYVYARDVDARDEKSVDGDVKVHSVCRTTKYDEYWIKQDINSFFNS